MQITIDTKKDSAQDIREAIALLKRLVEGSSVDSSVVPEPSGGAFNMFGDDGPKVEPDDDNLLPESSDKVEILPY